jgi:hypothetical protein
MNVSNARRRWGLAFIAGLVWSCFLWGGGGTAADRIATYRLHIESQPLDEALQEFALQTGMQIIFFSHLTHGRRSVALDGTYTIDRAMNTMLAESKLGYRLVNAKTIEIVAANKAPRGD